MEYKIGDITFSKHTQYDRVLYWDLFRIYRSLEHPTKDLDYASCVTGDYGVLLYRDIIDGKTTDDLYKKLLSEIKLFGHEANNIKKMDLLKRYYDRIIKSIPQNILDKIQNLELFKIGYIEKNVYDELMIFKNKLRDWLENPPGSNQHFVIDDNNPVFSNQFHDQIFTTIRKKDNQLEFLGDEYIVCSNCKTIIVGKNNEKIIDDYDEEKDYNFNSVEGYTTYPSIYIENSGKHIFFLEVSSNEIWDIIIETDSVKCINLMDSMLKHLTNIGWSKTEVEFSISEIFDDFTQDYFDNVIDYCCWPYLFRYSNIWENDNYIIVNQKYIKKNKLKKVFNPKKTIPLIKNKNDNSYYVLDKKSQKVLYTKTNEYVAESMLDFILKIVDDKIEL